MNFSSVDVGVTDLLIEKLIVVSFGSGDIFPIHGLPIPFRQIFRLTLSTCRVLMSVNNNIANVYNAIMSSDIFNIIAR